MSPQLQVDAPEHPQSPFILMVVVLVLVLGRRVQVVTGVVFWLEIE